MLPSPQSQTGPGPSRVLSTKDEEVRLIFGDTRGLSVIEKATVQLAEYYAEHCSLTERFGPDPEVTALCIAVARCRRDEIALLEELDKDLARRVMDDPEGESWSKQLFKTVQSGVHDAVNRRIAQLRSQGNSYLKQLMGLAPSPE